MTIIWIILDDVSSLQHSRSEVSVWSAGSCYSYCGKCKGKKPLWKMLFIFRLLMSWLCQQFCLCILIHNFSLDFISCTSCSVDIAVSFYNLYLCFDVRVLPFCSWRWLSLPELRSCAGTCQIWIAAGAWFQAQLMTALPKREVWRWVRRKHKVVFHFGFALVS